MIESSRSPFESRADAFLTVSACIVIALSAFQILCFGYGRDQSIYAVVADRVLRGGMPYRDAWDFKPPGIFLVYALAQAWFGKAMVSVRILEVGAFVGAVFAFRRIARDAFGSPLAGTLGGAFAVLVHSELEFWHSGQPEAFGGAITAVALAVVIGTGARDTRSANRLVAWSLAGSLFGAAFLMKPPLGGAAVPAALYLAVTEWQFTRRMARSVLPAVVMGVSALVPLVLCALWFWARGAWPALSWTLFEFTPGYTRLGWTYPLSGRLVYATEEALERSSYVLPAGLALAVGLPSSNPRERGAVALVLGIAAMQLLGVALQAKFFEYHYSATFPLLSLVAGLGFYKLWRLALRWRGPTFATLPAFAAALTWCITERTATPPVPGTYWERSHDRLTFALFHTETRAALDDRLYCAADYRLGADREVAEELSRRTRPDDSVFVWGFAPNIYWFSGRRPSSRYVYDVPQRAQWQRERARRELMDDLHLDPPRAIIVQHEDYFRFVTGDELDSDGALATFPELDELVATRYEHAGRTAQFDLYLVRD